MESIFHTLDCIQNPSSSFWQKLPSHHYENLLSNTLHSGSLMLQIPHKGLKSKKCVLINSSIYLLSKYKIPKYKSNINWKILEPFQETVENTTRYGFRLYGNSLQDFYTPSREDLNIWIQKLSNICILNSFEEDFLIIRELNKGSSALVKLCQSTEDSTQYVVKIINKNFLFLKPNLFQQITQEISVLRKTDHPNIVKLFRVYESDENVSLIMEYLPYGDGQQYLSKQKRVSESKALCIITQILRALEYLHKNHFVHRDLKLENFAFVDPNFENLKLIDFGLSSKTDFDLTERCGTVGYTAPEILRGALYNFKVDLFSVGVILYILISGKVLFEGKKSEEILKKNWECEFKLASSVVKGIGKETLRVLKSLLNADPDIRMNSADALKSFERIVCGSSVYIVKNSDYAKDISGHYQRVVYKSPIVRKFNC